MRNNQLTIFAGINVRNILMSGAIFSHILKDVANAGFRLKRINISLTHTSIPTALFVDNFTLPKIANLPPIKRTTKKNGMVMHAMGRNTTTFSSGLTICKLNNKQIGKFNLTITVTFSNRIFFTKTRMLAKPI